ncbi:MAG: hypothetical protein Q8L24_02675 [bacterium]|nr:hypothetical protein [bacterium]
MADWQPEPEFLEFLDAMEMVLGDEIPPQIWAVMMEIRTGSALGKKLYDRAMNDKRFRARYEDWKKHRNDP